MTLDCKPILVGHNTKQNVHDFLRFYKKTTNVFRNDI